MTSRTRRFFNFSNDFGFIGNFFGIEFHPDGIKFPTDNSENLWQGKTVFKAAEDCQRWLDCFKMAGNMNKVQKIYQDVRLKGFEPTDDEWALMQKYIPSGDMQKSEFVSFDTQLANNIMDRDAERISLPVLKSFAKSIVGKSKLNNHNWGGDTGEGRFYDAKLIKYSDVEEFKSTLGFVPYKNFDKHLEKVLDLEGGLYWFAPKFFMHIIDGDAIIRLKAGVTSPMSIGFRYPMLVDVKDENGALLWREYRNSDEQEAEALEGSNVFLGAQYGAQSKSYSFDAEDSGAKTEVKEMPINIKLSFGEFTLEPEKDNQEFIDAVEKQLNDSKAAVEAEKAELETKKNEELESAKANLEAAQNECSKYKDAMVEQIVQTRYQAKTLDWNKADEMRAQLKNMNFDELSAEHLKVIEKKEPVIGFVPQSEKKSVYNDAAFCSD